MTQIEELTINLEEIGDLIQRLNAHANVSKMTGYFEASYDIRLACQKLDNLSKLLKSSAEKESQ